MAKKPTKAERLMHEQVLAMLEWASDHPDRCHRIGNLDATKKAAELLAKRGVIEIWPETQQCIPIEEATKVAARATIEARITAQGPSAM
jgi:hypothetical protein